VYAFFYLCFCSFHVHESWYNENIKILVREIIGPAAAGSAGPVGMPARWMELRSWACGNDAAVLLITLDTCFRAPNTRRCTLCKHEYSQLVLQSKTDWQSNSGKRVTPHYFVAKLLLAACRCRHRYPFVFDFVCCQLRITVKCFNVHVVAYKRIAISYSLKGSC